MVKSIEDLTINDHDRVERTGKVDHLRKRYNFLPVKFYEKQIADLLNEVLELFSSQDKEDVFEERHWMLTSFILINRIKVNYYGIVNLLRDRVRANIFRGKLSPYFKRRKIKELPGTNLAQYIQTIKELTGIEIKVPKDLIDVLKDLEFKQDKFVENHQKKKKSDTPTPFMVTVMRIFIFMGTTFDGDMKLTQYATLQDLALKKYAREKNG